MGVYYVINDKFYHDLPFAGLLEFFFDAILLCGGYMGSGNLIPGFCNETILGSLIHFCLVGTFFGWIAKIVLKKRTK